MFFNNKWIKTNEFLKKVKIKMWARENWRNEIPKVSKINFKLITYILIVKKV